ncbi:type II 3-dehydroquinate dehydratase [Buchnera aphidicola]|uniref:3-dehydroquinate dehydratase n=1 Tax=Buchnera aphidicola subsp. Cinara cedri (strain Cc) TaxID=372461 RepID=AROQ_BUCCC|nr:type II 3-dehydroquinate dehydratase [Buchnera aphidicola]Q057I1.1 RecName: Full=3-dehydroquinate dehydratase; Short=3-dehydroquinase; AltName: Full=Type II DHQase [Buchnera aphidicola BCc]ABJ90718.1 3-dehydroquinate dehydratase [Buchnera aphidicola BCc]
MKKKINILLINGPNLNLLGTREPEIYGKKTLEQIVNKIKKKSILLNVTLYDFQSNAEHKIVEKIHNCKKNNIQFILINPGAFTHTSISIRDALSAINIPFFEIHISNIFARENFRSHSWMSDIAQGVISGFGNYGYQIALKTAVKFLLEKEK